MNFHSNPPATLVEALRRPPDSRAVQFAVEPPVDRTGDSESDLWLASTFALLVQARRDLDPLRSRLQLLWASADLLGRQAEHAESTGDTAHSARLRAVQLTLNRWATELGAAGSRLQPADLGKRFPRLVVESAE